MEQPDYINKIELLKNESDLQSLQKRLSSFTVEETSSWYPEYHRLNADLNAFLDSVKNGQTVVQTDIDSLSSKVKKFSINYLVGKGKRSYYWATTIPLIISVPAFYLLLHITPGYELFIIIPILALMIYLLWRSK